MILVFARLMLPGLPTSDPTSTFDRSIPVVGDFERVLGVPVLLVGFGLPGENAHAPDEWMNVESFQLGMRAMAALWDEYAKADGE